MSKESSRVYSNISRLAILSFALSRGIATLPSLVISLLLIEVGTTFRVSVGVAGQLNTASSMLAIVFAVLTGIVSVRYNHKTLLACGLILYAISALSSYFADTFYLMMTFFSLSGIATAMVYPMTNALIGELLPIEKRTSAIGWTVAGMALTYLAGTLTAGYLSTISGWRLALLLIVAPVTLLTLIIVFLKIPRIQNHSEEAASFSSYLGGYVEILRNKSALACLLGTILGLATWNLYLIYAASFWRQVYGLSTSFISVVIAILCLSYVAGGLFAGRLARKLGRKSLTALTAVLLGVFTLVAFNAPFAWLSMGISFASSFIGGMMIAASTSLTLEQVPHYRGTMMSTHSAATSMGTMIAAILGGVILLLSNYDILGIAMGVIGIVGSLIYYLFTTDPTHTKIR